MKENFGEIYDNMSLTYSELESMMGTIYEEMQNNPSDDRNNNLLQGLGSIGLKILSSQRDFTEMYGDADLKETLVSRLDEKISVLSNALSQDNKKMR